MVSGEEIYILFFYYVILAKRFTLLVWMFFAERVLVH
jgi:hypothetical protein